MKQQKTKKLTADKLAEYSSVFLNKVISLPDIVFYIVPLVILALWLSVIVLRGEIKAPQSYYLLQYVFTYDHGFVPRGLFGEILSWFVDIITDEIIVKCNIVLNAILVLTASLCFGKVLTKAKLTPTVFPLVVFLCVFIFFLPLSFDEFFIDIKLDKLVWCITLLAVFLSDGKYSIWLTPALCILATIANPIFVFTSMFLIAIILLDKYFNSNFSKKNLIICITSYVSIILIAILAFPAQKKLGFENAEELVHFYFSRYENPLRPDIVERFGTDWIFDYFMSFTEGLKYVWGQYIYELYVGPSTIFSLLWVGIPATALLVCFWVKAIKAEENKLQKFIYFLCALIPLATLPVSCISWEFTKYFGHSLITEFGLVLYFITQDRPPFKESIKQIISSMKANPFATLLLCSYILSVMQRSLYDF